MEVHMKVRQALKIGLIVLVLAGIRVDCAFGRLLYVEHAGRFVVQPEGMFSVTGIDLPIQDARPPSRVMLTIWSDEAGQPTLALQSTIVDVLSSSNTAVIQHVAVSGGLVVQKGEVLWVSVAAVNPGRLAWFVNSTSVGGFAEGRDPSHVAPWQVIDTAEAGAFRIVGEDASGLTVALYSNFGSGDSFNEHLVHDQINVGVNTIPEPSQILILVVGGIGICCGQWKARS